MEGVSGFNYHQLVTFEAFTLVRCCYCFDVLYSFSQTAWKRLYLKPRFYQKQYKYLYLCMRTAHSTLPKLHLWDYTGYVVGYF